MDALIEKVKLPEPQAKNEGLLEEDEEVLEPSAECHGPDRHQRLCRTYGKLLPSHGQPALIHHGGPRLHLLHRPELPVLPLGAIDRSASPDHLFQPSWDGPGPAPDQTACT